MEAVKEIIIEDKGIKIKIDKNIVEKMIAYRQIDKVQHEAGGILIGRENKENDNIIVEYATEPFEKDKRSRYSFLRKDRKHLEYYKHMYEQHNGIYAYIGEWHTHAEDYPNYSRQDIRNWKKIAKMNPDKEKVYYHIIVGNKKIRGWRLFKTGKVERVL